jgi:fatty acid synthase subunit alpha
MHEHSQLREVVDFHKSEGEAVNKYLSSCVADIEEEAKCQEQDALAMYGMLGGADARISPLHRALAV